MGEGAVKKKKKKNMGYHPISNVLQWITNKARGVSRHHLEGIAAASVVIFTCFYVVYRDRKEKLGPKRLTSHRSRTLAALHGGRMAMQRILDAQHCRVDPSVLDGAEAQLKDLLAEKQLDFSQLQSVVAKLEMSGKEDEALEMLSKALDKAKKDGDLHEAYELDMLIVEMLIYKGKYINALDRECLQHQEISDARRPLYKTIVQIISGHKRLAQICWNEFQAIRSYFQWPDYFHNGSLHAISQDFDEFDKAVNLLEKEIDHVHANKPKLKSKPKPKPN